MDNSTRLLELSLLHDDNVDSGCLKTGCLRKQSYLRVDITLGYRTLHNREMRKLLSSSITYVNQQGFDNMTKNLINSGIHRRPLLRKFRITLRFRINNNKTEDKWNKFIMNWVIILLIFAFLWFLLYLSNTMWDYGILMVLLNLISFKQRPTLKIHSRWHVGILGVTKKTVRVTNF